ncbi:hypothetical protein VNO77_16639 [Canavalia gladiata]|uniref:Uncharacterized protein n=1 Tax=Canavalia gladiata TaxID=3824 RepID=A0AAN9QLW2_CANGL
MTVPRSYIPEGILSMEDMVPSCHCLVSDAFNHKGISYILSIECPVEIFDIEDIVKGKLNLEKESLVLLSHGLVAIERCFFLSFPGLVAIGLPWPVDAAKNMVGAENEAQNRLTSTTCRPKEWNDFIHCRPKEWNDFIHY